MTLEEKAFYAIFNFLENIAHFTILSAHPPSSKSYFTDLIRIPNPIGDKSSSERLHVDIIFCSLKNLYLCEVKGKSSDSKSDIEKLKLIKNSYSLDELLKLITDRMSSLSNKLKQIERIFLAIGCAEINSNLENGFIYFCVEEDEKEVQLYSNDLGHIIQTEFNIS